MSLAKILLDISNELSISAQNDNERLYLIGKINDAGKELWESNDLPGSLRECTFNIDTAAQESSQVSLPFYVDKIRGLRFSAIQGGKIPLNDQRPRYYYGRGWGANSFAFPWRKTREAYPLQREIVNASVLTFTVALVEIEDIIINIVGKTDNSDRFNEVVTIVAGTLTADSIGNYEDITTLSKNAVNTNNIIVTDVEGNEISIIPNSELAPRYTIIALVDANTQFNVIPNYNCYSSVDVLYKQRFTPLVNLSDEYPAPNCDRLLFYKFSEFYWSQQPGNEDRAILAARKTAQILNSLNGDDEAAQERELQWEPNGVYEAMNPYRLGYGKSY